MCGNLVFPFVSTGKIKLKIKLNLIKNNCVVLMIYDIYRQSGHKGRRTEVI